MRTGNELYKNGKYKESAEKYSDALEAAKKIPSPLEPDKDAISNVLANRAACWLKLKMWENVIEDCGQCLEFDSKSWKAHWRMGEAHRLMQGAKNKEAAILCYRRCLALEGLSENTSKRIERALQKLKTDDSEAS